MACWLAALGLGVVACAGCGGGEGHGASNERSPLASASGGFDEGTGSAIVAGSTSSATVTQPSALAEDVCSLLSNEDVEADLQIDAVADGVEQPGLLAGGKACQWESTDVPSVQARIEIAPGDRAAHEALMDASADMQDAKPIDGVGERAQWTALTSQLDVLEGSYLVSVQVMTSSLDPAATTRAAKQLARTVIAELG